MNKNTTVTNVVIAGLGGQGVLKASDILADALFRAGYDIKKSEIHGMSQRGGSVASDVRFGEKVLSPMVPEAASDYLLVLSEDQVPPNQHMLAEGGVMITPETLEMATLSNRKSLNVALLGALSAYLEVGDEHWMAAIDSHLPAKVHEVNHQAFLTGRSASEAQKSS